MCVYIYTNTKCKHQNADWSLKMHSFTLHPAEEQTYIDTE